jgi:hypothetical protein
MEENKLQVACVGDYDETKEFCTKICRSSELCLLLTKSRKEGGTMFNITKIRVTKIEEFGKASEAVKSAEEAVMSAGFEIRAVTDKGDLQLTIEDLKKIAEGEPKEGEASSAQSVE